MNTKYICQNKLDNACFQLDLTYRYFKDFYKRTATDKILHDKAFNNAKNPEHDEYQHGLAATVIDFFDEKISNTNTETKQKNCKKNCTNQLLKKLKNEKYIHLL